MTVCNPQCMNCAPRWPAGLKICAELYGGEIVPTNNRDGMAAATDCCTLPRGHEGPHYRCQRK